LIGIQANFSQLVVKVGAVAAMVVVLDALMLSKKNVILKTFWWRKQSGVNEQGSPDPRKKRTDAFNRKNINIVSSPKRMKTNCRLIPTMANKGSVNAKNDALQNSSWLLIEFRLPASALDLCLPHAAFSTRIQGLFPVPWF
jgi:hypothetical protein